MKPLRDKLEFYGFSHTHIHYTLRSLQYMVVQFGMYLYTTGHVKGILSLSLSLSSSIHSGMSKVSDLHTAVQTSPAAQEDN